MTQDARDDGKCRQATQRLSANDSADAQPQTIPHHALRSADASTLTVHAASRLRIGDKLEACDSYSTWYRAKVVDLCGSGADFKLKVHFMGWNQRYDEWIRADAMRLRRENTGGAHDSKQPQASSSAHVAAAETLRYPSQSPHSRTPNVSPSSLAQSSATPASSCNCRSSSRAGSPLASLRSGGVEQVDRVFSGAVFLLTGFVESERETLVATLIEAGARIADVANPQQGGNIIIADDTESSARDLRRVVAAKKMVLLADSDSGKPVSTTIKVLFGMALGCPPLKKQWVHDCIKHRAWLTPGSAHMAHYGSRCRRGIALHGIRTGLLRGCIVVPLGSPEYTATWTPVLGAAGADVRQSLPPQHHRPGVVPRTHILMVEKRADALAPHIAEPLRLASQHGLSVVSQDWLKHTLLQHQRMPYADYPAILAT